MDLPSLLALPPGPALLFLPALALATGLELHATLVVLALAGAVSWLEAPPGLLPDLASGWVLGPAALLYLVELACQLHPAPATVWHAAQSLVRPMATGLLGLLFLSGGGILAASAAAGALAAGAWMVHAGLRGAALERWLRRRSGPSPVLVALGEDAVAVGVLVLALDLPRAGATVGALLLAGALVASLRFGRASIFGLRLVWDRAWSALGLAGWRRGERLPEWVRSAGPTPGAPAPTARRATPAALLGPGGRGAFRSGWLVADADAIRLWWRKLLAGPAASPLLKGAGEVERASLFDRLPVEGREGEPGTGGLLVVTRRGPAAGALRDELGARDEATSGPGGPPGAERNPGGRGGYSGDRGRGSKRAP